MLKFLKQYPISILAFSIVLYLCVIKMSNFPTVKVPNFDKYVHLVMTMGLTGVIFFEKCHYFRKSLSLKDLFLGPWLFPVLFTGMIELIQEYLVPSRSGDWMDFLYDTIGATMGMLICLMINTRLAKAK